MRADLILMCCASTPSTRAVAFPTDESLDERGRQDVAALSLSHLRADQAVRAPSRAAGETAASLGVRPRVDDDMRDCDFGRWAGHRLADIAEREPAAFAAWMADPAATPHGGESLEDVLRRVRRWLDRAVAIPGRTLAVTHQTVVRAAIVGAIHAPPATFWHLEVAPLTQVWLRSDGRRWVLRRLEKP